MRKSRSVVRDVEFEGDIFDINSVLQLLEKLEIVIPAWGTMMFLSSFPEGKIDVSFFEDATDFFLWYSKFLIRRQTDEVNILSFTRDEAKEWRMFYPPTLIGVNIKTRMRKQ